VIEFCNTTLSASPVQSGTPLFGPLAGCYGAAHGAFRVVYRVDDEAGTVDVLDIHRQERAALGN
jgi:mRNA interferase RelE/StbE